MTTKQDYATPPEFIEAVQKRFGIISWDLAASHENAVVPGYFTEQEDSLAQDWGALKGLLWLNPPFRRARPWAKKCAESASPSTPILMLTLASIGSHWFANHVEKNAIVLGLRPRITFVGRDKPFNKDLMLSCFGFGASGFGTWLWKEPAPKIAVPTEPVVDKRQRTIFDLLEANRERA